MPHDLVLRAQIILLAARRHSITDTCEMLSFDRQVVRRRRRRFREGGEMALMDRPRPGRPAVIPSRMWERVATLVVQPPTRFNIELSL